LIHSEFKITPCQKWQGFFCTYILGSFSAFHSRFFAIAKDVFPSVEISVIRNGKKSSVQVGLQIQAFDHVWSIISNYINFEH